MDNNDRVNCNIIRARWLKVGYPLSVDPTERFTRAWIIQRIIVVVILVRGIWPQMLLAGVGWYSMHDDTYAYVQHMHVYHKSLCRFGYYSFIPLQRIMSKCALHARKHQHIVVNLVIPLAGQWALWADFFLGWAKPKNNFDDVVIISILGFISIFFYSL